MRRTEEQIRRLAALTGLALQATVEALAQENGVQRARRIVVSLPDHKLAVMDGEQVVKIFPTAVGTSRTPSPVGRYTKGKVVRPGKANPIGTRWIGLSVKGYGIHGTNRPSSIGRNASHGCIRLRNHDVEELFTMVAVGDAVELYGTRTAEVERIFGVSEAHADMAAGQ
jgi:lipoprotein-anchoring transpeptidase ErfK/SrfK